MLNYRELLGSKIVQRGVPRGPRSIKIELRIPNEWLRQPEFYYVPVLEELGIHFSLDTKSALSFIEGMNDRSKEQTITEGIAWIKTKYNQLVREIIQPSIPQPRDPRKSRVKSLNIEDILDDKFHRKFAILTHFLISIVVMVRTCYTGCVMSVQGIRLLNIRKCPMKWLADRIGVSSDDISSLSQLCRRVPLTPILKRTVRMAVEIVDSIETIVDSTKVPRPVVAPWQRLIWYKAILPGIGRCLEFLEKWDNYPTTGELSLPAIQMNDDTECKKEQNSPR